MRDAVGDSGRPLVLAADEGPHRHPTLQQQLGDGSAHAPELTSGTGNEDWFTVFGVHWTPLVM